METQNEWYGVVLCIFVLSGVFAPWAFSRNAAQPDHEAARGESTAQLAWRKLTSWSSDTALYAVAAVAVLEAQSCRPWATRGLTTLAFNVLPLSLCAVAFYVCFRLVGSEGAGVALSYVVMYAATHPRGVLYRRIKTHRTGARFLYNAHVWCVGLVFPALFLAMMYASSASSSASDKVAAFVWLATLLLHCLPQVYKQIVRTQASCAYECARSAHYLVQPSAIQSLTTTGPGRMVHASTNVQIIQQQKKRAKQALNDLERTLTHETVPPVPPKQIADLRTWGSWPRRLKAEIEDLDRSLRTQCTRAPAPGANKRSVAACVNGHVKRIHDVATGENGVLLYLRPRENQTTRPVYQKARNFLLSWLPISLVRAQYDAGDAHCAYQACKHWEGAPSIFPPAKWQIDAVGRNKHIVTAATQMDGARNGNSMRPERNSDAKDKRMLAAAASGHPVAFASVLPVLADPTLHASRYSSDTEFAFHQQELHEMKTFLKTAPTSALVHALYYLFPPTPHDATMQTINELQYCDLVSNANSGSFTDNLAWLNAAIEKY